MSLGSRAILHARIEHDFRNHPPSNEIVAALLDEVTELMVDAAHRLVELTPTGREQSMMISALEEVEHHAKAAIARRQEEASANFGFTLDGKLKRVERDDGVADAQIVDE